MAITARILGTGSYLPKRRVDNLQIEKMVRNFDLKRAGMPFPQWVEKVTGIRYRHFVDDEDTETMAKEASLLALKAAGIKGEEVDFIIISSFKYILRKMRNTAVNP